MPTNLTAVNVPAATPVRTGRWRAAAAGLLLGALGSHAAAIELTMWVMPVTTNAQHDVPALIAPWLAQHPGVTVRVTVLDWESGWNKITAAAASRRGPDVLELGTTWMPAIAAMGGLERLSAAQLAEVGNGAPYYAQLWKTTQVFGRPGVYGLPWYADVRAAFYRTDVFRQAGVDPKQAFADWDSFRAALQKINGTTVAGKRVAALAYAGKNDWNVVTTWRRGSGTPAATCSAPTRSTRRWTRRRPCARSPSIRRWPSTGWCRPTRWRRTPTSSKARGSAATTA